MLWPRPLSSVCLVLCGALVGSNALADTPREKQPPLSTYGPASRTTPLTPAQKEAQLKTLGLASTSDVKTAAVVQPAKPPSQSSVSPLSIADQAAARERQQRKLAALGTVAPSRNAGSARVAAPGVAGTKVKEAHTSLPPTPEQVARTARLTALKVAEAERRAEGTGPAVSQAKPRSFGTTGPAAPLTPAQRAKLRSAQSATSSHAAAGGDRK